MLPQHVLLHAGSYNRRQIEMKRFIVPAGTMDLFLTQSEKCPFSAEKCPFSAEDIV